ncbi:glycosyltransferase family 39 protein [Nocardia harenae]|uniref:glycosyltransferase family 39 protein n=1 Tax=Nocardia harenae TaxID=358707 RepID=UPI00083607EF|nr:glycosyltransferase family 39 protein [Nocardia harenae]
MRTRLLFAGAALVYLVLGWLLAVRYGYLMGDALSRVQAVQAVLFSRDPHLAAIGFVFTPLTALLELPLVALSPWLPALTRYGVAGVVVSALFMAGAVVQVYGIGVDRGAPRWLTALVTAVFAVNPMILCYALTGMSEAPFVFCVCWGVRRLIRWVRTDDIHDLITAGAALGLGYLARYDAVVPIAVAAAFVALRSYRASRGRTRGDRLAAGVLDALILIGPGVLAVLTWFVTSWLLTGEGLAQFSSAYGNAAIIEQSGGAAQQGLAALGFSAAGLLVLAPALPLIAPVALALGLRRRDVEVLVPTLVLGSVLAFQAYAYFRGATFPLLRFYIAGIPLVCVYTLQLAPPVGAPPARRPGRNARPRGAALPRARAAAALAAALLVLSLPLTALGLAEPTLSVQQYALRSLFTGPGDTAPTVDTERRILASFRTERAIADYLDAQHLPDGSVVTDSVSGFGIVVASDNPKQFVIPSDEDFITVLSDPAAHGVRYILAVPATGRGAADAVNRRYPTIYENGGEVAVLELEAPNDGQDQPDWRLYRVIPPRG